eukprot:GDKJ01015606.1.p1 GENE.GDKJ01015606.1~~GDKJ01015606.1.p1  ORF type:complete len:971 (+),score=213.91 GDKJ01015606.1:427-2913(+)
MKNKQGKFDPLDETKPFWKRRDPKRRLEWILPERPQKVDDSLEISTEETPFHQRRVSLQIYDLKEEIAKAKQDVKLKQICASESTPDLLKDKHQTHDKTSQETLTNSVLEMTPPQKLLSEVRTGLPLDSKYTNGRRRRVGRRTPPDLSPSSQLEISSSASSTFAEKTAPENALRETDKQVENKNKTLNPGTQLIAELKRQALLTKKSSGASGDSKLESDLKAAVEYYPGIDADRREREIQEMMSKFSSIDDLVASGNASVKNANMLIKSFSLAKDLKSGKEVIKGMAEYGLMPNEDTFVSLMQACVTLKDPNESRLVFLKMRALGINPTEKTYATMIRAHTAGKDVKSAFALLRKMEDENLKPDVVVYTALIDGCVKARDYLKAWEIFREIRTWKMIEPDEVLFTVMIKACAKQHNAEQAMNILDDMRMSGLHPTKETYEELIRACANAALGGNEKERERDRVKWLKKSFEFFDQMQAENMVIDHRTYQRLLSVCGSFGDVKRMRSVLRDMRVNSIEMTAQDYSYVILAFANNMRLPNVTDSERSDNIRNAWIAVKSAQDVGCKMDVHLLNNLMKVYANGGYAQHAVDMLDQYQHLDVEPNRQTFETLLRMLGKDLNDPGRFFALFEYYEKQIEQEKTIQQKKKLSTVVSSDLQGHEEKSEIQEENHQSNHSTSLCLTPSILHTALDVAMESKSASKVLSVLNKMEANGVWPTVQLTERLSKVGRNIPEIHEAVIRLMQIDKRAALTEVTRTDKLIKSQIEEHALRESVEGRTPFTVSVKTAERKNNFEQTKNQKVSYTKKEWQEIKKKGGQKYSEKVDRPKPNPYTS